MTDVYLSLGSNIDPETNLIRAVAELKKSITIRKVSTVYRTRAVDRETQPDFYNCVLLAETEASAREMKFNLLRPVESLLGRKREEDRYASRTIDIDILLFGSERLDEEDLKIPDPDLLTRPFLARALLELSPGIVLPGSGIALTEIAKELDSEGMTPLGKLTERLRALIQ